MMSASLYVRSSSPRELPSTWIEGRTGGGGTGITVMSIHSGRAHSASKPRASQSCSEMRLKIVSTFSGVSCCFVGSSFSCVRFEVSGIHESVILSRAFVTSPACL